LELTLSSQNGVDPGTCRNFLMVFEAKENNVPKYDLVEGFSGQATIVV